MKITNDKGRAFLVRVVLKGERWGLNDCLTHDDDDPLIEFYDLTCTDKFGPRGQFVSNYFASTLAEKHEDSGICLDGGNADDWSINASALADVLTLARTLANAEVRVALGATTKDTREPFVMGLAECKGCVGMTFDDDDPESTRSAAYDQGRTVGCHILGIE